MLPPAAAPSLQETMDTLKALKNQLREQWGVSSIALFGSVARQEASIHSDVDVLIEADQMSVPAFFALCDFLEAQLNRRVDVVRRSALRATTWEYIKSDVRYV